tara:strand:+ start:139 stop:324 length:186 start_codon:yes stop_codon:yes gene_type:complete
VFHGTDQETKAECYLNGSNEITLTVYYDKDSQFHSQLISLDKSTAIKLAKTLRTEINKIKS